MCENVGKVEGEMGGGIFMLGDSSKREARGGILRLLTDFSHLGTNSDNKVKLMLEYIVLICEEESQPQFCARDERLKRSFF